MGLATKLCLLHIASIMSQKICTSYEVTLLNWTPAFELYMAGMDTKKASVSPIGPHVQI